MKVLLMAIIALLTVYTGTVNAQAPKSFNYQGVARDAEGQIISKRTISLRLSIVSESNPNQAVYTEVHQVKTNNLGLFAIRIGQGGPIVGSIESVDWGSAAHYLSTEMDVANNGHYVMMGTAPLLSVPYALYAEKAGSSNDGNREIDFSGIFGQTIRHNGTEWETSSTIYNNGTNVGLGTTSPAAKLDVNGNVNITLGKEITFGGERALAVDTNRNIMQGRQTGAALTSGVNNNMIGYRAGWKTTSGSNNSIIGYNAGYDNTTGSSNMFLGYKAGYSNTTGSNNFYSGLQAGYGSTTGINNIAIGTKAGSSIGDANDNTFVGREAGLNTINNRNTFIGKSSGDANTNGTENTYIGYNANGVDSLVNATAIGANAYVAVNNSVVLGNAANIGIGTSSPEALLHVSSEGTDQKGGIRISGGTGNSVIYMNGSSDLVLRKLGQDDQLVLDAQGNVGIGTSSPQDKLEVQGAIRMVDGNEQAGYIPVSDSTGRMVWTDPLSLSTASNNIITDSDNDTKIQVEEGEDDDDIIRFDVGGTQRWIMKEGRIEPTNTGNSVFIGKDAGQADDYSGNINIFIGFETGKNSTSGYSNTAIGAYSFQDNTTGFNNVAIGSGASSDNTNGSDNVAIGHLALYDNKTGKYNTAIGTQALEYGANNASENTALGYKAGHNSNGSHNVFLGFEAGKNKNVSHRLYIDNSSTANPLIYGEFDNKILVVNGSLKVNDGTQSEGYVFTCDSNGTGSWQPNISNAVNAISDNDNDTKIQLEETADEDIIRFDIAGNEALWMEINANEDVMISLRDNNTFFNTSPDSSTGINNTFIGKNAGNSNTTGQQNTYIGARAGQNFNTGRYNVFIGEAAGVNKTSGNSNVFIGDAAGQSNFTGSSNVFVGDAAGIANQGSNNIFIGSYAGAETDEESNRLYIEGIAGNGDNPLIYGEFDNKLLTFNANVGIGTSLPTQKLHVIDNADGFEEFVAKIENTANSNDSRDEGLLIRAGHNNYSSSESSSMIQFETPNGDYCGRIRQSGTSAVEYVSASDERLKTQIVPTKYGLDDLMRIQVKDYYYKADRKREDLHTGFLAQQLYECYPKAVDVGGEDVTEEPWGVAYGSLTPLLVKAVQDQQEVIESLLERIETLEKTISVVKSSETSIEQNKTIEK